MRSNIVSSFFMLYNLSKIIFFTKETYGMRIKLRKKKLFIHFTRCGISLPTIIFRHNDSKTLQFNISVFLYFFFRGMHWNLLTKNIPFALINNTLLCVYFLFFLERNLFALYNRLQVHINIIFLFVVLFVMWSAHENESPHNRATK